jgi:hypothetical protein
VKWRPAPRRWIYVEQDGALFRGFSSGHPQEVWWARKGRWEPYSFEGDHKPVEWGSEISLSEALKLTSATPGVQE